MEHKKARSFLLMVAVAILPMQAWADGAQQSEAPVRQEEQGIFGHKTELTIGGGVTYAARYAGGDVSQLQPAPVFSIQRGILFADSFRGAGLQYQSASQFYVSQSVFYDPGRLDRNSMWRPGSSRLAGMLEVPGSATTRTLVAQPFAPWVLVSAETEMALRDAARRNRYRVGVEFTPLKSASDTVTVDLDGWYGDARYCNAYFGVTPGEASHTRFSVFTPGAGLYEEVPGVSWEHHLDSHWSSTIQLTGTRYTGKVRASPIVAQRTSSSTSAVLAYTY